MTAEDTLPLNYARKKLRSLFDMADRRLRERGVIMRCGPGVVEWLIDRLELPQTLDPVPNLHHELHHVWSKQVGNRVEEMLLDGRLKAGESVHLDAPDSENDFVLKLSVSSTSVDDHENKEAAQ